MKIESMILNALVNDSEYNKKVIPHLKDEYFHSEHERITYQLFEDFVLKYERLPTKDICFLEMEKLNVSEETYDKMKVSIRSAFEDSYEYDFDWLMAETEQFCKDKAVYNAIMKSVKIATGEDKKTSEGMIPTILSEALSICFDTNIGHDYFEDAEERYEYITSDAPRIPFKLSLMNKITKGGTTRKTLNGILAQSGGGKSAMMCDLAASYVEDGYNVLYVSLEMADMRVGERLDANLLNVPLNDIKEIPKDIYLKKLRAIEQKSKGKLILKEYPTGMATANDIRLLIGELRSKKGFVPDIVFVDYLGIMSSFKYKNAAVNTNTYLKSISEELRAVAVQEDLVMWTAMQTNRGGYNSSDLDETDFSESIGVLFTLDLCVAIMSPEELIEKNQMLIKQLKNRYNSPDYYKRFIIGFDRSRMRSYDVEESGQLNRVNEQKKDPVQTKGTGLLADEVDLFPAVKAKGKKDFNKKFEDWEM